MARPPEYQQADVILREGVAQAVGSLPPTRLRRILSAMSDAVTRLNTALEGRYAVERERGEGGMATVYLADHLGHEQKVAHLARMSAHHV